MISFFVFFAETISALTQMIYAHAPVHRMRIR